MLILSERTLALHYGMPQATADLRAALLAEHAGAVLNPPRTVLDVPESRASALYMPAALRPAGQSGALAVKVVTIYPGNPAQGRPTTQGVTLLSDAATGEHLALLGASYLTRLRTGAVSALAAEALARPQAASLAVIGTGAMAHEQVLGLLAVRPVQKLFLYNPGRSRCEAFARTWQRLRPDLNIALCSTPEEAVAQAELVVCATRSSTPVFQGTALRPGTHITAVGSYLPSMRELDLDTLRRTDKVVVDTLEGTREEAGELLYAQEKGVWSFAELHAELPALVAGARAGRENEAEITLFKCVGTAYFDLAVALGAYQLAREQGLGIEAEV
ncbi:ornithine cyclodeaminase family protein [Deinococcus lacus]|uniref:Ornithine cyclodeaminase family protein n=1 Tax=Deinococcus lacus TaxID=392561 RepID=A0ABW1YC24_9DEIO